MSLSTTSLRSPRVVVIGAGVGGLAAAALLARQGLDVRVIERGQQPGGKLSQLAVGPSLLDAGPTVLTMRWVFDALFERLGQSLDEQLSLRPCAVLARHAWGPEERLDLLADLEASVTAMADFAGPAQGQRYLAFCERAKEIYDTLEQPFLRSQRPTPWSLAWRVGMSRLPQLARISPFRTLWQELGRYFPDPRLRQLFGRYATYCGSSPFDAPATLMLVAHVEREAVWQIEGGMHRLAQSLAALCQRQGVQISYGREAREILLRQGRVCGVALDQDAPLQADAVLFNGDVDALRQGLLGQPLRQAMGGRPLTSARRSLSAVTWHLQAEVGGFPLSHHNVFFSDPADEGYRREFADIAAGRLPAAPSVYVCAQDRTGDPMPRHSGQAERLMCLVNAPATADARPLTEEELLLCQAQMFARLTQAGLKISPSVHPLQRTSPQDFARRFPATGGALYGQASRGWRASFQRPASTTRVPGLYLAGGSVHPGPGLPMAALSGQLAAEQICAALRSTRRWQPVAMPGGMSMR
ncbi:1-hydroxycarotenoid 3,4-desaturase CrtD [Roseateles toxinivorans]|uniref:1-hydroxycarotenoid 3,4-desaturase n=1 Tax=Roseateles toxinivorans TaxID=270368 RepID=A0A4R6QP04_9BURK|nr:1-hydroxycarotenoid 3,4-desaturase CrtD [Roseateles toxinivorans]TDP71745.1 1-hydroxycarotenoid 3,4-desaturase [Roseateles toxinivorans]